MLQQANKLKIFGKEYQVEFAKVGQFLDVEVKKIALSNGTYVSMINNSSKTSIFALDLIDAIANFSVLIPQLEGELGIIKNFEELDIEKGAELVKVYREQFWPWYREILKVINPEPEKEADATKNTAA